jgi:RNA polymerase sigma-70 factor, ECF subfamily
MVDWPKIMAEHGPLVWRTVFRLLSHEADAEDAFQRTFVSAVDLASSQVIRAWPAVLKKLATARALEMLRTRYRERGRRDALPVELVEDLVGTPLSSASHGELQEHLREALTELDATSAQVFCLVVLEGFTNQEAATQLGLQANHVGVLLHRARGELRLRLSQFAPEGKETS